MRGSLPREGWPAADSTAWEAACRPSIRLQRGGSAGHLKPVSQRDLARGYGTFLHYLKRNGRLSPNLLAGAHVTPENVDGYLQEAKSLVRSVTVYNSIYKLRRATQLLAPGVNVAWLIELEKDLALVMVPRSKYDRLVLTHVLIDAGLILIEEARSSSHLSNLKRAQLHRNGLMVAMLAHHPIRLKNFAALEIGRTFLNISDRWWIVLSADDTKERRPDERPLDPSLQIALDDYLTIYRPILARAGSHNALWISSNDGAPMSYSAVEKTISETTRMTVGINVSPHLFRTSIASTAAMLDGQNPQLGSALLHHVDRKVKEEHYNRASCSSAGQAYLQVVKRYRSGN